MNELDPETLNPGIRRTVMWLRSMGYETTDSGDGVTNGDMECFAGCPMVAIQIDNPHDLIRTMCAVGALIASKGVMISTPGPQVEGSWALGGPVLVIVTGVDDALLFGRTP